jgi:hypothetical protein
MTITRQLPRIDDAIDAESWEWLQDNAPELATAVYKEVQAGANPDEIQRHIMRRTQRPALALRCEQSARHLVSEE